MKKFKAVLLVSMTAFLLSACSSTGGEDNSSTDNTQSEQIAEVTPENEEEASETEVLETEAPLPEFSEITVVDNEFCSIKITGIEEDALFGYTLNSLLENKSSEITYMFSVQSAAVNGVQITPLAAEEVAPGMKSNSDITLADGVLEENGISEFTDIELEYKVYDSNDWLAEPVYEGTTHIYPYGEENASVFVRESQDTDNVLVDNEAVSVIVTGYEVDDIWGYTVDLFIQNKSDKELMVSVDDAAVNGFMADPFYASSVAAGKCEFSSMSWSDTTLEENDITEVNEIQFTLSVSDANDWMADDIVNETIVLNP